MCTPSRGRCSIETNSIVILIIQSRLTPQCRAKKTRDKDKTSPTLTLQVINNTSMMCSRLNKLIVRYIKKQNFFSLFSRKRLLLRVLAICMTAKLDSGYSVPMDIDSPRNFFRVEHVLFTHGD